MTTAIHSETPVKSTIAKIATALGTVISLTAMVVWYAAIQLAEVSQRLASIENFIRNEAVTQSQAERYAAVFRWENRSLSISVPEPEDYRDRPKS